MKISEVERRKQYRKIFENLWETPRIYLKDLGVRIDTDKRTAGKRLKEASKKQIIVGPDLARRSYDNLKEYVSFVKCEEPELLYLKFCEDPRVIYHAVTMGFCDLWLITKKKIDIEGDIVLGGYRSDYYTSFPPDYSWETTMEIASKETLTFDHREYIKKDYIKTHLGETVPWDVTYGTLYRDLRDNLRKPVTPIMKEHNISGERFYKFLEDLPRTCTIATHFYPDTLSAYDPYLFMFETEYEDFIIDLFSKLPTSTTFFNVSNKLLMLAYVPKHMTRGTDIQQSVRKLFIPLTVSNLVNRKIVGSVARAIVEFSWSKDI